MERLRYSVRKLPVKWKVVGIGAYDHVPVRHEITSVWTGRSFQSSESQAAACSSHSHRSPQPFPSVALTKHSSTTRTALFCFIRHHLRHERLYHSAHPLRPKPTHSCVTYSSDVNNPTDLNQKPTSPARHHHGCLGLQLLRV